jgi:hypothetical protein
VAIKGMKIFQRTSYALVWLVFSFLLPACKENKKEDRWSQEKKQEIVITEDGSYPRAMIIPRVLLKGLTGESIRQSVKIFLQHNTTPVLGEYAIISEVEVIFVPLVPFTRGLTYEIKQADELIATITIPQSGRQFPTGLLNIYPSADTVPENLLKFYLEFSKPMQEGHALENIFVIKNDKDTIPDVFLDLLPELWNKERTVLTLWLDPGRIKQDLQPNKKMGAPLEQGNHYKLIIGRGWRDAEGNNLVAPVYKEFFVGSRDNKIPNYNAWEIQSPKAGATDPLKIFLHEPLDYYLLKNGVHITDSAGNEIAGTLLIHEKETILVFAPATGWKVGNYVVEIESRLEDPAGNNLNRPFDRDISKKDTAKAKEVYTRSFSIQ